ncbi:NeuD/PglB/VioB family sugar acetyltransferase [Desulfobulbus alkaliphilus]|uniref:NeuD/PglB/VioB family sugar acetyltransferase n=1 Tax=Desulfobulbus alkaliphilus TaxID=869814 RepID=UPI00196353EC|nr:NeuD/PglB/VioB family sugar acetyltransferase [Desulfobulbus alkaliphilus]MBM9538566.1 NeuD/PglB/VioB family sugar acetyltransferase [Desulfobulbus alkaliphilus]
MKDLIIIGARGYGRELCSLVEEINQQKKRFRVKGFLDDNRDALTGYSGYPPILASVEDYIPMADEQFVCALGIAKDRKKYTEMILAKGGVFATLVHPTALFRKNVVLGRGVVIQCFTVLSCDVQVEDHVHIQGQSNLGHDCKVGKWSQLSPQVFMGGYSAVEHEVQIYTKATILPHIVVGAGATVGAGSVVLKNVRPGTSVFGVPAKII